MINWKQQVVKLHLHDPHVKYWEEKDVWINQDLVELMDTAL